MEKSSFRLLRSRPLSLIAAILAVLLILYETIQIAGGELYQRALYFVDGTTLIELGILTLLGVFTLRDRSDLQAVSSTLVAGLSFIFIYEAIYKFSFYLTPAKFPMPPQEFRELVIQIGITATILTNFANGFFTLKKWTWIWLGLLLVLWIFWLLVGFPQITGELIYPQVIPVHLTHDQNYILNRSTKAMMFFAYLTLFPPLRKV